MKRLTLLRHAKSSWDNDRLTDHDRPLAARGLHDAPLMGSRLAEQGLAPGLLLSSTALRARQTAELVAPAFSRIQPRLALEPRLYLATPGEMLAVVAALDDELDEVILIGHNPGLTDLANRMLPNLKLDNLPTAGAIAIDCVVDRWRDIDAASFRLHLRDRPPH